MADAKKIKKTQPKAGQPMVETKKVVAVKKPAVNKVVAKKATLVKKVTVKAKEVVVVKEAKVSTGSLRVDVVGVNGVKSGTVSLPTELFGVKPNKSLIMQAIRVYLANQRQGTSSTKTRGKVKGSTRKIYRQKGTGRARHGAITAPIFVGGGIVFGPHPRDYSMKMPKKMKKAAFASVLSQKANEGVIKVVDGQFSGKTSEFAKFLKTMNLTNKTGKAPRVLLVVGPNDKNIIQGAHNIGGMVTEGAATLSTYTVSVSRNIIFAKDAIQEVVNRYQKD